MQFREQCDPVSYKSSLQPINYMAVDGNYALAKRLDCSNYDLTAARVESNKYNF